MFEFTFLELIILCGSSLLTVLLFTEILDWAELFSLWDNDNRSYKPSFGYERHNGPLTWKLNSKCDGKNQSPINIPTRIASMITPSEPLEWKGYRKGPSSIILSNEGVGVELRADWSNSCRPFISGGPLCGRYNFHSMIFHWGPSSTEGSEHTLDYTRFPMELQLIHLKHEFKSLADIDSKTCQDVSDALAIVSVFFQITKADNPYLDHIITNLWQITPPNTEVYVPPFPLSWIFPTFEKQYYTYNGSLTRPPCDEIVLWIINPEPVGISSNQMSQFRKICSAEGRPLRSNCRPVQLLNSRDIYFYD